MATHLLTENYTKLVGTFSGQAKFIQKEEDEIIVQLFNSNKVTGAP